MITPHDPIESDDMDQEKELLSTPSAAELALIKVVQR